MCGEWGKYNLLGWLSSTGAKDFGRMPVIAPGLQNGDKAARCIGAAQWGRYPFGPSLLGTGGVVNLNGIVAAWKSAAMSHCPVLLIVQAQRGNSR